MSSFLSSGTRYLNATPLMTHLVFKVVVIVRAKLMSNPMDFALIAWVMGVMVLEA